MHVFITGGTGLIGSAVTAELLAHGHTVLALARSDDSAHAVQAAGAQPLERPPLHPVGVLGEGGLVRHRIGPAAVVKVAEAHARGVGARPRTERHQRPSRRTLISTAIGLRHQTTSRVGFREGELGRATPQVSGEVAVASGAGWLDHRRVSA
jgi:NAD(P)-dependent dehydrogenase (short-subunit alcohol dehydrogenase family)